MSYKYIFFKNKIKKRSVYSRDGPAKKTDPVEDPLIRVLLILTV